MNYLLDAAGSVLYVVISVIISPLIFIAHCVILSWVAYRYVRSHFRRTRRVRTGRKGVLYPYPVGIDLTFN
ncbi:MAG TPA: hypothetical protein VNR87_04020 [Flavisolibacter sp.]|nr:hypothetical protein [Flavisolibacter sp.]